MSRLILCLVLAFPMAFPCAAQIPIRPSKPPSKPRSKPKVAPAATGGNSGNNTATTDAAGNPETETSSSDSDSPESIVAANFRGIGKLDLAVAVDQSVGGPGGLAILLGNGDGTSQPATSFANGISGQGFAGSPEFQGLYQ